MRLRSIAMLACVGACSGQPPKSADVVGVPLTTAVVANRPPAPPAAPWSLTASDGSGLALVRVDAKAVFTGPLAFTELHLYFHNPEARTREGTFQITLPSRAAVARFAMANGDEWMEAEVVDKALARLAYDDFVHRGQDPALLEKAAGNQFTARVFPIPANADKHVVISYSQTLAGEQYVLPLRGLPKTERVDVALAITGADGKTTNQRLTKRNWQADRDFVSSVSASAAGLVAGRLVVAQVQVGDRAAPTQPPGGITLLVDTSASRAVGYESYLASIRSLVGQLRVRWGDGMPLQIVAFDQTTQRVFGGRAADVTERHLAALTDRGAAGASDLGQALSWLAQGGKLEPRLVVVTDAVITAGVEGAELASRATELARVGVDRLDVVLAGELRDEANAELLARAGLPHAGIVLDLDTDPVAVALAEPVAVDVPIEVPRSVWSYPRRIASARPGTTTIVYARLDTPAQAVKIRVGGRRVEVTPLATSGPLLERAITGAEIEELETDLLHADEKHAVAARAVLAKKSVASRVLSSQTSMLVLETDADYERYQIDRKKLACTLVVGPAGLACARRARRADVVQLAEAKPPTQAPVVTVTGSEITFQGELVATTESVLRDDSPTFTVDALREQLAATDHANAAPTVVRIDETTDARLVNKLLNTAKAAGVNVQITTHNRDEIQRLAAAQSSADRRVAQERLVALRRQQADLQPRLGDTAARTTAQPIEESERTKALSGDLAAIEAALAAKDVEGALVKARDWHAREPDNVLALIGLGQSLEAVHDDVTAARIYGSIIDLFPGRADLRRFAGERLERVADHHLETARSLIIDTYRRAVADRPDHLTGHRLLAYALLRDGKPADAFAAILAGIDHSYRADSYRGASRVLADDAGMIGAAYAMRFPELRPQIEADLAARTLEISTTRSTRFILYWETDANDVDFHIRDATGEHAFYQHMRLASGGELYADITTGYGPECFAIAGTPKGGPYRLGIHYYSRGPMGYGMGMLEIQRFDGKGGLVFEHRPYVVMNDDAYVALGKF